MWKHIPATDRDFDLFGKVVQLRRGNSVIGTMTISKVKGISSRFNVEIKNSVTNRPHTSMLSRTTQQWVRDYATSGLLHGAALYIWEEVKSPLKNLIAAEDKINKSVKGDSDKASGLVLVHKPYTKLTNGLKLVFKPYTTAPDQREFTATVSRHGSGVTFGQAEVIQVHIACGGIPIHTISFRTNLDERTVESLDFFNKYACYLDKSVKEKAPVKQTVKAPTTVQGKVVTDEDEKGKYIIWCPTSDQAPQKILNGQKQAKAVAATMSEKYGKAFYWARLMGCATQKSVEVVTIKKETSITTL